MSLFWKIFKQFRTAPKNCLLTSYKENLLKRLLAFPFILIFSNNLFADVSIYQASPTASSTSVAPMVLFALSFDHELFKKAYSDYSDIDGDGEIDITYKDTIDYYGYFESQWCYQYNLGVFRPISQAGGANSHFCTGASAPWSGNFLNWASMSRIDLIRKVLYGGKRSTDTSSSTILERAEIPFDFHAYGKIYNGPNIPELTPYSSSAITLCSVTNSRGGLPLLRIATGANLPWIGFSTRKCASRQDADLILRVEACHPTMASDSCTQYGSGSSSVFKPTGLIQQYHNQVKMGLVTGSFQKNVSGGVLRKNISFATDEFDPDDGRLTNSSGMIAAINAFRINEYNYSSKRYSCTGSHPVPCRDWGNPISEIYLEALRYIKGVGGGSSDYSVSSSADLGLPTPAWTDPYTADNRCANCAIIVLSTGQNSFDGDNFSRLSDVLSGGMTELNRLTNEVGNSEPGISFPGDYTVGGMAGVKLCEPKRLNGLADARGICPEIPEYSGSYYLAGLSSYARSSDLRPSLDGEQSVVTYSVELAQTVPSLTFAVSDGAGGKRDVSISPACQTSHFYYGMLNERAYNSCRFLDLKVDSITYDSSGMLSGISFSIAWADEMFGGDGDTDVFANYTVTLGTNNISVRLHNAKFQGANGFRVGYAISGVQGYNGLVYDADYNWRYGVVGGRNTSYDDGDSESALILRTAARGAWCSGNGCKLLTPNDVIKNFTPNNNTAGLLPKPLLMAAKYGGFSDFDNDGTPNHDSDGDGVSDSSREWDNQNNITGADVPDGIPDNYFFSKNPAFIAEQLRSILESLANNLSSASNVALVSNSGSGAGLTVSALFQPMGEIGNDEVAWIGRLQGLFIDSSGHLREDSNQNGVLEDYATDSAVQTFFDASLGRTLVQRYDSTDGGVTLIPRGSPVELKELKHIWRAHDALMDVPDAVNQRTYADVASTGRHIFTWLDDNNNGSVDAGEDLPFTPTTFGSGREGYLDVAVADVKPLVNFIRGEDQPGYRSRTVDYDGNGSREVWRLSDIVNSNPVPVSIPQGFYSDSRSYNPSDSTFRDYLTHYQNRRQVIYVGSNGGLLHAFNAGFWNDKNQRFDLNPSGETAHPLGSELWAYAPMNLLPHLQWLKDPDYPHVYYMDGKPLVFDANIFPDDADHPHGWGTVLVMGMGFGGGPTDITIGSDVRKRQSAYVVLDVTNPEKPPKLLAEVTHPDIGFTTARPEVIQRRQPDSTGDFTVPASNEWYLVFGSGPEGVGDAGIRNALDNGASNQNLKVFIYDLQAKNFVTGFDPLDTGVANAYAGDFAVVDWDKNNSDDFVYFGSIKTAPLGGELLRIDVEDSSSGLWSFSRFLDVGRPITSKPLPITNKDYERWVFVGTGRELVESDSRDTAQEYFIAVKEPQDASGYTQAEVPFGDLIDTTSVEVRANGDLSSSFLVRPGATVTSFSALRDEMRSEAGWINLFASDGVRPSNKNISPAVSVFALLLFTEYEPPADQCMVDGSSFLNVLHYQTGTALPASIQRVITQGVISDTTVSTKRRSLGQGRAPAPVIHDPGNGNLSVIVQGDTGNITQTDLEYIIVNQGRQSWRQIHKIPRW